MIWRPSDAGVILAGRELAGTQMTDIDLVVGVLTPDQLQKIDRVLRRLGDRLILDQAAKKDAPDLALSLFQCGFTGEDQLLEQLVETLRSPPRVR